MRISSLTKEGLPELWESCEDFKRKMLDAGEFQAKRERQLLVWMWTYISNNLMDVFKSDPDVKVRAIVIRVMGDKRSLDMRVKHSVLELIWVSFLYEGY